MSKSKYETWRDYFDRTWPGIVCWFIGHSWKIEKIDAPDGVCKRCYRCLPPPNTPPDSWFERLWRRLFNCSRDGHCFHTPLYEGHDDFCCECGKEKSESDWNKRGIRRWWFYHF